MKKPIETHTFAGDKIEVFPYGPDFEAKHNGRHFGVYLSPAACVNAVQQHIIRGLEK